MYNLVVCSIFKNESHILDEWIRHYQQRGVDHLYLVNDFSSDNYAEIIDRYPGYITLFQNDIVTTGVNRQLLIYEKYFRPLLGESKWFAILDLDEFLYSPTNALFADVLFKYRECSQIRVDWLHFGSNGHVTQPASVVKGFTRRALFDTSKPYYSYKTLFQGKDLMVFAVHAHQVRGLTRIIHYNVAAELVINHYNIQSLTFYMTVKATRGDVNNWVDSRGLSRSRALFDLYDTNDIVDMRLARQS